MDWIILFLPGAVVTVIGVSGLRLGRARRRAIEADGAPSAEDINKQITALLLGLASIAFGAASLPSRRSRRLAGEPRFEDGGPSRSCSPGSPCWSCSWSPTSAAAVVGDRCN